MASSSARLGGQDAGSLRVVWRGRCGGGGSWAPASGFALGSPWGRFGATRGSSRSRGDACVVAPPGHQPSGRGNRWGALLERPDDCGAGECGRRNFRALSGRLGERSEVRWGVVRARSGLAGPMARRDGACGGMAPSRGPRAAAVRQRSAAFLDATGRKANAPCEEICSSWGWLGVGCGSLLGSVLGSTWGRPGVHAAAPRGFPRSSSASAPATWRGASSPAARAPTLSRWWASAPSSSPRPSWPYRARARGTCAMDWSVHSSAQSASQGYRSSALRAPTLGDIGP